jgi:diguanylate cyclase (GGDEF)-like protein/PAS domain S-box-containing protein
MGILSWICTLGGGGRRRTLLPSDDAELGSLAERYDTAMNYMSEGLCFFDGKHRLVTCNRRYIEMYQLDAASVRPGMTLKEIVALRFAAGSYPKMAAEDYLAWRDNIAVAMKPDDSIVELSNGRVFEIHHRPMPDGGWVATHEDVTERFQAQTALAAAKASAERAEAEARAAHAWLLDALDLVPEGLAIFDREDRYVLWNRKYAEMFDPTGDLIADGATFEEVVRKGLARGWYPEAVGQQDEWLARHLALHRHAQIGHEQQIGPGRWCRVEERRTQGGSIGLRVDITDLKRREESFRLLFEENPMPMWVVDFDTHQFLAVNAAAVSHYGYSREQFLSMNLLDVRPPEDRAAFLQFMKSGEFTQGESIRRHLTADGRLIQVRIYGRAIVQQGRAARLSAIVDVSGQQRAQEQLITHKLQTEAAVENMSQGLLMFDREARLVLRNQQYIDMYRLSPDVVKPGCTLHSLIQHRKEAGLFAGDEEDYCRRIIEDAAHDRSSNMTLELPDGRCIRVVSRPMAGGGWVATHEDITESKRADERIKYMAHHDLLTGLANRTLFLESLEEAGECLRREGEPYAVLIVDLDRFKDANDSLGHAAGDMLLTEVARRLKTAARKPDVVARLGGDEFAVLRVGEPADRAAARDIAEAICRSLSEPIKIGSSVVDIDASIGIALAPADGSDPNDLMKMADLALYRKKSEGRNGYQFFDVQMMADADVRHELVQDLRHALAHDELAVHYQPIIDAASGECCGAEALVRWNHPTRGPVSPEQFIPLAEENGMIVQLGEWVLHTACLAAASWPSNIKLAINLSPAQFRAPNLLDIILMALVESSLAPDRLELEITESMLIENHMDTTRVVRQLKNLGVSIALDDFGTGYSSLSYLTMIPFDMIKIDRSFTQQLSTRSEVAAIVSSILTLASGLGIATTAEGVETAEQFERLRALGVTLVQGYLFARARPACELEFLGSHLETGAPAAA